MNINGTRWPRCNASLEGPCEVVCALNNVSTTTTVPQTGPSGQALESTAEVRTPYPSSVQVEGLALFECVQDELQVPARAI